MTKIGKDKMTEETCGIYMYTYMYIYIYICIDELLDLTFPVLRRR